MLVGRHIEYPRQVESFNYESCVGVAGDLTPNQRDKLKKLQKDGLRGYYRNDKLHVNHNRNEQTHVPSHQLN